MVIAIHNKHHINSSSIGYSKSSIIYSPVSRVLFPGDSTQVPIPQDFINYNESGVESRTEFSLLHYVIPLPNKLPIPIKRNQIVANKM